MKSLKVAGVCAALVILVFLVFGQTLRFGFVSYDDNENVYETPQITGGISLRGIEWAFTHTQVFRWAPLTTLSRQMDCQFFGLWAGGHHLTNVVLHALAAVLLFLVLCELTDLIWRSGFVAAAFAIHPLHVEAVAWVSARGELLCGVFFMLALWSYTIYAHNPQCRWQYALSLGWYLLGLMSKSMLVTLPFVLLLLDYWPLKRFEDVNFRRGAGKLLTEKIPFFALSIIFGVVQLAVGQKGIVSLERVSLAQRVGNAAVTYALYLWQMVWPANLAVFYPLPGSSLRVWEIALSMLVLGAVTAAVMMGRKKQPWLAVGWLWYMGMLAPVIGIVQAGEQAHADRYTYLPMTGICIALTWTVAEQMGRGRYRHAVMGSIAGTVLFALAVTAWRQTSYWRNSNALWTHTLECTTDNYLAQVNIGHVLFQEQQTEEAIAHFREALRIDPDYDLAHNNLGLALLQQGHIEEAAIQFREVIRINPDDAKARWHLGLALFQQGHMDDAIAQFREALRINATDAQAHYSLGLALVRQGSMQDAIAQFREAIRINPTYAEAYHNIGIALFQQGRTEDAIAQFDEAIRIYPTYAEAYHNLGLALLQQGRPGDAIAQFRETVHIKPDWAEARNDFANALLRQGKTEEAVAQYREALRINPAYADVCYNLGIVLLQQEHDEEALAHLKKALELQPANANFQSEVAWLLAAAQQTSLRNGAEAVRLALQASHSTGGNDPAILRILAAAYAEAGDFSKASQTAQTALQMTSAQSNPSLAESLRREIKLYSSGRRFDGVP